MSKAFANMLIDERAARFLADCCDMRSHYEAEVGDEECVEYARMIRSRLLTFLVQLTEAQS